jgi:hypothetical protein
MTDIQIFLCLIGGACIVAFGGAYLIYKIDDYL